MRKENEIKLSISVIEEFSSQVKENNKAMSLCKNVQESANLWSLQQQEQTKQLKHNISLWNAVFKKERMKNVFCQIRCDAGL